MYRARLHRKSYGPDYVHYQLVSLRIEYGLYLGQLVVGLSISIVDRGYGSCDALVCHRLSYVGVVDSALLTLWVLRFHRFGALLRVPNTLGLMLV